MPLTDFTFNDQNAVDRIFYGRINIKKASSFLFYNEKGIVKSIIHNLKYKNQEKIGALLGDWYGQIIAEKDYLTDIDYVVPVPLHRKRLKQRGYNQVSLFAKRIALHIGATYNENILVKTANTKTQTKKGRIARFYEKKGLFTLTNDTYFQNKNILLVDDVITTGATMEMCTIALQKTKGVTIYITSMAFVSLFHNS